MTTLPLARLFGALAICVTTACTPGQEGAAPAAASNVPASSPATTVNVENIAFQPAEIRVLRSTAVTWVNGDAGVAHTVTSGIGGSNGVPGVSEGEPNQPDGLFDGDLPAADGEFSFTFNALGTYAYYCEIHPSMTAVVVVE